MKLLPLFAVALGLVAAAPDPTKDDLKKLQGAWNLTAWEQSGQPLPKEGLDSAKFSVKNNKYTFELHGVQEEGTIKLDSAKKPATIDLAITSGGDKGKDQVGIYRIEGDTITCCFARPGGKVRPTEFTSTQDNGHILVTIKRAKKDN
jgi:uncharacterized protein (TIGR03067 family)